MTPTNMARKIHNVRKRSKNDNRLISDIATSLSATIFYTITNGLNSTLIIPHTKQPRAAMAVPPAIYPFDRQVFKTSAQILPVSARWLPNYSADRHSIRPSRPGS
jgi:hypothetical protein